FIQDRLVSSATFNAQAETPQFAHPLLDYTTGATVYMGNLSQAISNVIGNDGTVLARGAGSDLEAALKQPLDRPRTITFSPDSIEGEVAAIPVCVEQNRQILGKWMIQTSGQVVADNQPVVLMEGKTPCKSWLIPQGMAWMK
ncbi:hypothetical protein, partial [Methylomonas methanica]